MTNAAKFLNAFAAIEKHLRGVMRAERYVTFSALVETAAAHSAAVRRHKDDLKEFADLRNAIVHERSDGRPIAEPHGQVVTEIQRLAKLVLEPAVVLPAFHKQVQTVERTDSIRDVLKFFSPRNFSQVPVTSAGRVVGLLTANTLSRWLASETANDIVDLREHSVADALRYTEHEGNWRLVSRTTLLAEVVDHFDSVEASGKRLDAILVTQTAKATDGLLGIITIHDMPKVLRLLEVRNVRRAT
jgi:CBS domain-containing protein